MKHVTPVPCQHIADYYRYQQTEHPCIANNLLQRGYQQFSEGVIDGYSINNLFRPTIRMEKT